MTVAELSAVTKSYGRTRALAEVSFAVGAGEVVALLGPNGAGKTTAISLLLGLRRPDSGRARLFGGDPRRPATRRLLGATPQESTFPGTLRVRELLDLVRAHYPHPEPATALLGRFGLAELGGRQVGGLSGGQRRRLGVALAFAGRPRLVVLDEPTAGLDGQTRLAVWEAVRDHAANGGSLILTTHHLEEADALATRVMLLDGGRLVAEGMVGELKAAAGTMVVRFRALPGIAVPGAVRDGDLLVLHTRDSGAEVTRLVQAGLRLVDLEVRPLTLEEALAARRSGG